MKPAKPSDHPLKISFTEDGRTIKEVVDTYQAGNPLDRLIAIQLHMLQLGNEYELLEDGKWKKLCATMRRVLIGSCKDEWKEKVNAIRNFETVTSVKQRKKFKKLIQEFNKEYFADDTLKIQTTAMRDGELRYDGHDHRGVIKILFVINKC